MTWGGWHTSAIVLPQALRQVTRHDWLRCLLPAALLTCSLALYNRFPLVYSDSGGYLENARAVVHGLRPDIFLRPLTYGLALAPFASRHTLWLLPLVQGLLVAWVVDLAFRVARVPLSNRGFLGVFVGLVALTSLPWVSGQVMPDVFTGLVVLLAFVLLWGTGLTRTERRGSGALLTVAIASHLSHLPLYGGLLVLGLAWRALLGPASRSWRRVGRLAAVGLAPLVLAVGIIVAPNYVLDRQPVLSQSSALFSLAHLVGDSAAQRYLDRACPTRPYLLCADRATMPVSSDLFLWEANGPWKRHQGDSTFLREAPAIVAGTWRQEWPAELRASLGHAAAQLVTFGTNPSLEDTATLARNLTPILQRLGPQTLRAFQTSRQMQQTLPLEAADVVQRVAVGLALLVLLACLPALRGAHRALWGLIGTVGAGVVLNALVLGSLGVVLDRYQSRVVWLVPLAATCAAVQVTRVRARRSWPQSVT